MNPVMIVAELSANHGHDLDIALQTVRAAKASGADAIKLQTYTPDTITIDSDQEWFRIDKGTKWDGRNLYDLYAEAYTPWEWHEAIKKEAEDQGLVFFSTPFDRTAVDFLEGLGVPMYKIASFEITDLLLIEYTASKGKPIILSTGIATLADIEAAVTACRKTGNETSPCLSAPPSIPPIRGRQPPDHEKHGGDVRGERGIVGPYDGFAGGLSGRRPGRFHDRETFHSSEKHRRSGRFVFHGAGGVRGDGRRYPCRREVARARRLFHDGTKASFAVFRALAFRCGGYPCRGPDHRRECAFHPPGVGIRAQVSPRGDGA